MGQTVITANIWSSLQALHLDPRGSSPGTGGPAQHKSCSERGDYLSSPRRDMGTGILSDSFTLIIRTEWQDSKSTDTYQKCFMKNTTATSKKNFPKVPAERFAAPARLCHLCRFPTIIVAVRQVKPAPCRRAYDTRTQMCAFWKMS